VGSGAEGGEYHHAHAAAAQEDGAGQLLAVVVRDFGLKLYEANAAAAEEVDGLDIDFAELVRRLVEGVVFVLLGGEGVLQRGYPSLEGGEGEQLFFREILSEMHWAFGRGVREGEGGHGCFCCGVEGEASDMLGCQP